MEPGNQESGACLRLHEQLPYRAVLVLMVEVPCPRAGLQGRDRLRLGAAAVWGVKGSIPSAAGEEKGSGNRGAGEGCCQHISLPRT